MADWVPLIDLSEISIDRNDDQIDDTILKEVGTKIKNAFSTSGFCYFVNHGISQELIEKLMAASLEYFKLPTDEKVKVKFGSIQKYMGWIGMETEALNLQRPCDYREGFNYHAVFDNLGLIPAEFLELNQKVFDNCLALVLRVIDALSLALDIDRAVLRGALNSVRTKNNSTCIRSIYYPPVEQSTTLKENQLRCGEHSDYGIISLVFQDDCGGLEVKSPDDGYIPVPPIKGSIVANIGDLLQRWTADALVATEHRVVVSKQKDNARKSFVFFTQPDDDCTITCLDGSNKYDPLTSAQHLENKMHRDSENRSIPHV